MDGRIDLSRNKVREVEEKDKRERERERER